MADPYWRTGTGSSQRLYITWPSLGQLLGQLGLAAIVALVWGGLLFGFLRLTGLGNQQAQAAPAAGSVAAAETPTWTPTPIPTSTPTLSPTVTPTLAPTLTPEPTSTEAVAPPTGESPIESSPTATPTETPLPPTATSTPTETQLPPTETPAPVDPPAAVSFSQDVFPILERRCIKCHGGPKDDGSLRIEEGLDMRAYSSLLEGSWNGPVIEPGNVEDSFLIEQIVTGEMPKKEPRLLPGEIRTITAWIEAGAPDN